VLPACASMAAMKLGQEIHGYVIRNAYEGKCMQNVADLT
jgi:hypothetical protein